MRTLLMGAALLALAGCDRSAPVTNAADNVAVPAAEPVNVVVANVVEVPVEAPAAVTLGKVDLGKSVHAFGTEPFWGLDIDGTSLVYTDASLEELKPETFTDAARVVSGGKAVYTAKNKAGAAVTLTLTVEECLEAGEPEDAVPLTVELKIGDQVRHGCAGPAKK
jgi:uncharacterized membrane protein